MSLKKNKNIMVFVLIVVDVPLVAVGIILITIIHLFLCHITRQLIHLLDLIGISGT